MIRYPRRTVPAAMVALVGLVVCLLVAVSCVEVLVGAPPVLPFAALARWAATLPWNGPVTLTAEGIAIALGALLVGAALLPGRPTVLPLRPKGSTGPFERHWLDLGATRTSVARALRATAAEVDGVDRARVRVSRNRVRVRVSTPLRQAGDLADQVRAALDARVADLALARYPRITVRVATRKEPS